MTSGVLLLASVLALPASSATDKLIWKPLDQIILRVDGKAPQFWNAYRAAKKDNWILLKLWRRYLLVDLKEGAVYDLDPQKLRSDGANLEWLESEKPAEPILISDWNTRDVGPAYRIRFRFGADGRVLDMQLPHRPDRRSLY